MRNSICGKTKSDHGFYVCNLIMVFMFVV